MIFTSAREIEQIVWQLRLADYPRSLNRARINSLANGAPPYDATEEERNAIEVNVNDLSMTRLSHEARQQLFQAFNKPGNFFTCRTDGGAASRRLERGTIVTNGITKRMKRSDPYFECQRSKFALEVLHGIGPGNWEDQDHWCPTPLGVEDVLIPSNTLLTFRNLPFFALFRPYTAAELKRLTRRMDRNPGWNEQAVKKAIEWADSKAAQLYGGSRWSEYWSPEKQQERIKQDSGVFASDLVPTIDCWDFYYWDDEGKKEGWRQRIIFDAYGGYSGWMGPGSYGAREAMPEKNLIEDDTGMFLFSSGNRVVAESLSNILHFQIADLSAVAPFRYHSIRSLGFLLFAACHLQNRLRCSFSEAVFENLMMYLQARSESEVQRALNIQLANRRVIDETIRFIPPGERWQPNPQMVELGLAELKQIIAENSASYVQDRNMSRDRVEKTRFQVMAEVQAMQTLVSAALQQAYRYQASEYREIFRRFMKKNSEDPDVRSFRAECLTKGVPEKLMTVEAWDIEPERVIGGGNKTLEMAVAQQLMEWRAAFAPEAQQQILRKATLSITDDAAEAEALVPRLQGVSSSRYDAMASFGTMMAGGVVGYTESHNRMEVLETLMTELETALRRTGPMTNADKVLGFQNVLQHIGRLLQEVGADPAQKERVRRLSDAAKNLGNMVKALAQRVVEQMKAQGVGGNGAGEEQAKLQAKLQSEIVAAQAKAANARESHAQRTAQKQVSFEAEEKRKEQQHQLEMRRKMQEERVKDAARGLETIGNIRRADMESAASAMRPTEEVSPTIEE
jgi:hypothetical protein